MVWSIAIAGMIMALIVKKRYKRISIGLYPGLGWLIVVAIEPIIRTYLIIPRGRDRGAFGSGHGAASVV